jgi:lysozyme
VDLSLINGSKPASYFFGEPKKPIPTTPAKPAQKPVASIPKDNEYMYTVKSGDTLTEIAAKYKMAVADIVKLNEIKNPNAIYIGQRLKLKGKAPVTATKPAPVYYVVKKGDTLTEIAAKYKTTVKAIDVLNANVTNVNKIYVGQKIRVK